MSEKSCREVVYKRAEYMCERCTNVSRGLTVHHRLKRSHGGRWDVSNCVLLCGSGTTPYGCHSFCEHYPDKAATEGFHVRPWENPAEIPVLWRGTGLVLLTDDGGFKPWRS